MIAAWMLYCTGVALLIGAAGTALDRTVRLMSGAGRWVWVGAMLMTFGLPVAARYRPTAFAAIAVPLPQPHGQASASASPTMVPSSRMVTPASGFSWADLDQPLALLWGGLSLGLLGIGAVAALRLRRLQRAWRPATVDGTAVLVSSDLGPAVVGVVRCHLVVPAWTLELDSHKRELLLAHEREHLRVGDPRLLAPASLLLALMPWNPGLWWQWRRLRLAVEMDCDARVLRRNPDRARYGDLLLEVSQRAAQRLIAVAAFHEPMSLLERRIRAISSGRPKQLVAQALGASLAAAVLIVAACQAPRPQAPTGLAVTASPTEPVGATVITADSITYVGPQPVTPLARPGLQTMVVVEAIVDTNGRPEARSARVVSSVTPGLEHAAIDALVRSRFRPARLNGKAVRALIQQPISLLAQPTLAPTRSDAREHADRPAVGADTSYVFVSPARSAASTPTTSPTPDTVEGHPVLLQWTPPVYPPLLRQAGIAGVVTIEAVIDTNGRAEPSSIRILQSSHAAFNYGAEEAMLKALWRPARVDGRPARMLVQHAITFLADEPRDTMTSP